MTGVFLTNKSYFVVMIYIRRLDCASEFTGKIASMIFFRSLYSGYYIFSAYITSVNLYSLYPVFNDYQNTFFLIFCKCIDVTTCSIHIRFSFSFFSYFIMHHFFTPIRRLIISEIKMHKAIRDHLRCDVTLNVDFGMDKRCNQ